MPPFTPPAILVNGLAKKYCRSLRRAVRYAVDDLLRGLLRFPAADTTRLRPDEFWALEEVNFRLPAGETLGVIGANGAGKSTLLKLLAGILEPDRGRIELRGRVGCLIELGAGFHPQLTGRENIYVNGAILGMKRRDIRRRFDDIVAFSGLESFIETPVKYYSSGMYVRLGFAIAAHVELEILLVDEVLSVGDLAFQSRCLDRIEQLRQAGATFLFVSHDLSKVARLCPTTLVLDHGRAAFLGHTHKAIDHYRTLSFQAADSRPEHAHASPELEITGIEALDLAGQPCLSFPFGATLRIRTSYRVHQPIDTAVFNLAIFSAVGLHQCSGFRSDKDGLVVGPLPTGEGSFDLLLPHCPLLANAYLISATVWKPGCLAPFAWRWHAARFTIEGGEDVSGVCHLPHRWELSQSSARREVHDV